MQLINNLQIYFEGIILILEVKFGSSKSKHQQQLAGGKYMARNCGHHSGHSRFSQRGTLKNRSRHKARMSLRKLIQAPRLNNPFKQTVSKPSSLTFGGMRMVQREGQLFFGGVSTFETTRSGG